MAAEPDHAEAAAGEFPLVLNTGRVRDQWHTMTRTGRSPTLGQHIPEPYLEVHPDDAAAHGLADGGLARVRNRHGAAVLRVAVAPGQRRGTVFAPIHWIDGNAAAARIGALVAGRCDPISGQPEAKATPVAVEPVPVAFEAVVVARDAVPRASLAAAGAAAAAWASLPVAGGRATLATFATLGDGPWIDFAAGLLGIPAEDLVDAGDPAQGCFRAAGFRDGRLVAALAVTAAPERPSWKHLADLLGQAPLEGPRRRAPLATRGLDGAVDPGPTVCACFGVGRAGIEAAVAAGCRTACEIGIRLKAGTNCGSCLPEIRRLLSAPVA